MTGVTEKFQFNDEDKYLCPVLDHQSCTATCKTRISDHRDSIWAAVKTCLLWPDRSLHKIDQVFMERNGEISATKKIWTGKAGRLHTLTD